MSKPKYWWYGNVCRTICEFPRLQAQVRDMRGQKITPGYSAAAPGGGATERTIEDITVRVLSSREYRDYEAVEKAITTVRTWRGGEDILAAVSAHAWRRIRFEEVARSMHISTATAKNMHRRFVYTVAQNMGYGKFS